MPQPKPFVADLATAVENLVYIIEQEQARPNGGNRENVAAAREGLKALTGSKHVPTARLFIERERAEGSLQTKAFAVLRALGFTGGNPEAPRLFYERMREAPDSFAKAQAEVAAIIGGELPKEKGAAADAS